MVTSIYIKIVVNNNIVHQAISFQQEYELVEAKKRVCWQLGKSPSSGYTFQNVWWIPHIGPILDSMARTKI